MSDSTLCCTQDTTTPFNNLPPYIGAVLFESFLYGLYVILFAICAFVLLSRHKRLHWILLLSATAMFTLATSDIIYTYCILFEKLLKGSMMTTDLRPKYWLYITNNVIADSLLLYRCWVVWEYRKLVILGPIILLIAGTACGYALEASAQGLADKTWIYLIITVILNIILTALTAGRIWWLARIAKFVLATPLLQRYNATINILIESGLLHSLYIILTLGLRTQKTMSIILDAGLIQVVGIIPTLIIVEVGLGCAVHDLDANEAIARLEENKTTAPTDQLFEPDAPYARARERRHASSLTFVSGRRRVEGSSDVVGEPDGNGGMGHEIPIESLRRPHGENSRMSWEFGVASPPELGVLQQISKTI